MKCRVDCKRYETFHAPPRYIEYTDVECVEDARKVWCSGSFKLKKIRYHPLRTSVRPYSLLSSIKLPTLAPLAPVEKSIKRVKAMLLRYCESFRYLLVIEIYHYEMAANWNTHQFVSPNFSFNLAKSALYHQLHRKHSKLISSK